MKSMTYGKFLKALTQTPRKWFFITPRGAIRLKALRENEKGLCPIAAVEKLVVRERIQLPEGDRSRIVSAADADQESPPGVRRDLLAAVGLSE